MSSMLGASGLLRRVATGAGMVAATLLMLLATGPGLAPAFAQASHPEARITGEIQPTPPQAPPAEGPSHTITEVGTGDVYGLIDSRAVNLSQYQGQTVTINGIFQTQGNPLSGSSAPTDVPIYVTSVEAAQGGERPPSQVTVCVQKALADQLESGSVDLGAIAAECNVSIEEVKENIHPSQLPGQYDDDSEDSPSSQYEDDAASDQYDNGVTPSQYEDDSTGDVSAGSSSDGSGGGLSVLPDTGGASLLALGVGALLVAGGLLARRIVR